MPVHILVVDDKLVMAEMLADALADRGYETRAVASGSEALAEIRRGPLDLVVTDLRMPGLDGLALIDAARASGSDVPVIVMTAYGAVDSAAEALRRGAYHYVTKPFKVEDLLVHVERALATRAVR